MIVPMKRVTLVSLASERDQTLRVLRDAGVVHVTDVQEPFGSSLDEARARLKAAEAAANELSRHAEAARETDAGERRRTGRRGHRSGPDVALPVSRDVQAGSGQTVLPDSLAPDEVVAQVEAAVALRREATDRADAARRELARVAGLGEFDPSLLADLARRGVYVCLVRSGVGATPVAPEGFLIERLGADAGGLYWAIAATHPFDIDDLDLAIAVSEVRPPQSAPSALRAEVEQQLGQAADADDLLVALAPALPVLKEHLATLADAERFAAVRAGMGTAHEVVFLQGYVPAESVAALGELARVNGWGVQTSDPVPGDDVPTMLRYSQIVAPVRAVLDFLKIYPGYWETDIGWTFLAFFSVFFAMLAGDAGYGVLLLIAASIVHVRVRSAPRYAVHLLYIVGTTTLIWGIITGNYFGITKLPSFMTAAKVDWLADRDNVIQLCFIIGAVHLSIAHVWNVVSLLRERTWGKAVAQFGYLLVVWSMFFLARQTVLGLGMPSFVLYMLAVGFLLVAGFMATPQEFKESFIGHALLPLNMISNFVDILSYIRLFAVGYASIAVIAAFNEMASSIGFGNVGTAIAAVLLILFANVLNLILIGLGVLVHAVRLNTLEFSTHKGLEWAGHTLYQPFTRRSSERS